MLTPGQHQTLTPGQLGLGEAFSLREADFEQPRNTAEEVVEVAANAAVTTEVELTQVVS